jgi:hypothetical protein
LVNFGKTHVVGTISLFGGFVGALSCLIFSIVLELGFIGVILSIYTFNGVSLVLSMISYLKYTLPIMKKLQTEYHQQGNKGKANQIHYQENSSLLSLVKLGLKLFISNLPMMIGWNVLTILVGFGNNKG